MATNVQSDTVYMNGLYNGREDRSSRARLPSYVSLDISATDQYKFQRKYALDMHRGETNNVETRDYMWWPINTQAHLKVKIYPFFIRVLRLLVPILFIEAL